MKNRKIAALILAAVMMITLAGCGGASQEPAAQAASSKAVSEAAAAPETEAKSEAASAASEASAQSEASPAAEAAPAETAPAEEAAQEPETAEASADASSEETAEASSASAETAPAEADPNAPAIEGLTFDHTMLLEDAQCFNVYYYQDGYKLIDVPLSGQYLVIPEGGEAPAGIDPEIYLLYQPLDQVYMAATGSMSFIEQIDAMKNITLSSLDEDGWVIDAPKKAMQAGDMTFAGKYSEPDYELMVGSGCDLAIESTMILHSPEVQEMIEDLGIPVFIDRSSYELDAFGRIEWIKLYAAMFNKDELAEERFAEQKSVLDALEDFQNTGKTVAFFAMNSNKTITVRKTEDFIPNMIELAGGKYIFENLENPGSTSASVRLSMEEFYNTAVNADYLIYNGTIEEPLSSIDDLLGKDQLFAEFKAVKEGNVWTVDKTWYQSTATIAYLITDLNRMLTGGDPAEMVFLHKVG